MTATFEFAVINNSRGGIFVSKSQVEPPWKDALMIGIGHYAVDVFVTTNGKVGPVDLLKSWVYGHCTVKGMAPDTY